MKMRVYNLFLILTLVLLAALILSAKVFAEEKFIIGFPEDNMSNDWRAAQINEIRNELKKHKNVEFLVADAAGSIAKNILDIEDMVNKGAQLLFLGPKNPDAIAPIAAKLRKKGIYIVLLTRKLKTQDYDVYISPSDYKIAQDAAKFMVKQLKGKGRILMLEGVPSTSTALDRKKGFLDVIKKSSGIKMISKVANYSRSEALVAVENLLRRGVKFDAIYAHNDAMASGARFALKQHGINPASIPTIGIDFLPETRKAIMKGEQLASFKYPTCGKAGVKAALALLNGKKVSRYISVPSKLVTKKNVQSVNTVY